MVPAKRRLVDLSEGKSAALIGVFNVLGPVSMCDFSSLMRVTLPQSRC
jgi:hypothetical protein